MRPVTSSVGDAGGGSPSARARRTAAWISGRPSSTDSGLASSRHSFMPLCSGGRWLAVTVTEPSKPSSAPTQ